MRYLLKFRNTWLNRLIYKHWFKKHLNTKTYRAVQRGRHSNRKKVLGKNYAKGLQNDIRISKAETIAVYLRKKEQ